MPAPDRTKEIHMGYTTDFEGSVTVTPPLNASERTYLLRFAQTRRMDRTRGPYFVDGTDGESEHGQGHDSDIRDYERPPAGQPSLWCGWVPTEDGTAIEWDGVEKFRDSEVWMQYLIDHFLRSGGRAEGHQGFEDFTFDHVVNGVIHAQGEDSEDAWDLIVTDNAVTVDDTSPE
ncbi:hypothetical protein [Nocardia gipuzkoensis]|uniref:hypothetical protein n=1 Tax=Nocardia gipuzkoensis TaxID=2749991 RepID=UPI00237D3A4A|nr:hypothetical protein [Nocardia gipuzkoensis]MDE1673825.1 hypothetical protein [Nocardia gipuzkoensis]